jgi:transcriptional regulator with XRE-family HTH domain
MIGGITMAIGQRIRFFRNRKGMTQKNLGEILGFVGKTSDVRMAQYESEARVPKQELVKNMAHFLDVSTHALTVPDIDTYIGLMHTFFALEDMYGLKIDEVDGEVCLRLDKSDYSTYTSMDKMLRAWLAEAKKLESGESTKEQYDDWRYKYPELDTHQHWAKVYPQELFDFIDECAKEAEKEEKKEAKRQKKK